MTSFSRMGALARRSLIATALTPLFGAAALAQAQSVEWSTDLISIDFDPGTFSFVSDTVYAGTHDVFPALSQVDQGVLLNFGGSLAAYASSYQNFSSESREAHFNAFFNFTPQAGYAITGYTVTYEGGYFVESPASVGLSGQSGTITAGGHLGGDSFNLSNYQEGATAPEISGWLSAWAEVEYIEIFDHYEQVYTHDEQVLDYCETEEPFTCYYTTVPVYSEQPVYRYESDLGEGQIFLSSINVQAHVVAVPEPGAVAMTFAGLLSVGWWGRRRRTV